MLESGGSAAAAQSLSNGLPESVGKHLCCQGTGGVRGLAVTGVGEVAEGPAAAQRLCMSLVLPGGRRRSRVEPETAGPGAMACCNSCPSCWEHRA